MSLSGEAAKKTKQWLAMEVKSTCILRSGKGGTKRHAFSDRPTVRFSTKRFMKEHAFTKERCLLINGPAAPPDVSTSFLLFFAETFYNNFLFFKFFCSIPFLLFYKFIFLHFFIFSLISIFIPSSTSFNI